MSSEAITSDSSGAAADPPLRPSRVPIVLVPAVIGAAFGLVQLVVLGQWVLSDHFAPTPTPTGSDPVAGWDLFWTRTWEVISVVGSIGVRGVDGTASSIESDGAHHRRHRRVHGCSPPGRIRAST